MAFVLSFLVIYSSGRKLINEETSNQQEVLKWGEIRELSNHPNEVDLKNAMQEKAVSWPSPTTARTFPPPMVVPIFKPPKTSVSGRAAAGIAGGFVAILALCCRICCCLCKKKPEAKIINQ